MQDHNLVTWIRKRGVRNVAEALGIAERTVQNWVYLQSAPQFDNAYKLKVMSKGVLGFDEIYQPYFNKIHKKQNSNKKFQ
jgi:hypothetical protein